MPKKDLNSLHYEIDSTDFLVDSVFTKLYFSDEENFVLGREDGKLNSTKVSFAKISQLKVLLI